MTGLIVGLTAKAGKVDELAAFLRDELPLVQDEPDTIAWFAVAIGGASFAIIDAFPTVALELPAPGKKPRRIASPQDAQAFLAALPKADRPVWAGAFYAGLRSGELLGLRVEDVDFGASTWNAWSD